MVIEKSFNSVYRNSLFKGISTEVLKPLFQTKNFREFAEGAIIFRNGETADSIYLITVGEVKIKFSESRVCKYKFISDFFGEQETLDKTGRVSSAVANKETHLYLISTEEFFSLITKNPAISANIEYANRSDNDNSQPSGLTQSVMDTHLNADEEIENELTKQMRVEDDENLKKDLFDNTDESSHWHINSNS